MGSGHKVAAFFYKKLDIVYATHYNKNNSIVELIVWLSGGDGLGKEEVLSGLILELRRGTIVLSVLSKLKTPMYGYSLVSELSNSGFSVETNTLYPLLRRLESQGLLKSEWETGGAKPRKYYSTTDEGDEIQEKLRGHWLETVSSMNKLWREEDEK